jgi:uroporphyrinogen-III synthase
MNLNNLCVLVTRPKPQGETLCEKIRAAGGVPVYFPVMEIIPPDDVSLFKKQIDALDQFDYLIFISPQAVMQSAAEIHARWPKFPARVKVAAIGAGTAAALKAVQIPVTTFPAHNWRSEGLLELPEFQEIKNKNIAIICGKGGRELLEETLAHRGAKIISIIAYQRNLPRTNETECANLFKKHSIDIIICTSNECVQNLLIMVGEHIMNVPIIVVSERIAAFARKSGFKKVILAENASHESIMETLFKQKGLVMENKMNEKKVARIPWAGLGVLCTTFAVIVLITAFCFSFYKIAILGKKLENAQVQLHAQVESMKTDVDSLQQNAQQSMNSVQQALTELRQIENSGKDTWRVREAGYYVELANANLQFENNIPLAIQLLQTADHQVQTINDPKLDVLRKVLADDIANLQSVPQVDYKGIYLRLAALDAQVDKLPMLLKPAENTVNSTTTNNNQAWWRRGLEESWQTLQKIVVVRYRATGAPPLVTPEQQDFLMQNIHGMLQRAMWAVINKNADIYHSSLQQAIDWMHQYFMANSALTESMQTNLVQLQQIDIHPTTPKIIASVQAFHDYLASGG